MVVTVQTRSGSAEEQVRTPTAAIRWHHYLIVLAQLGLLILLFRQFAIESGAFIRLAVLAFAGFGVHALLPMRLRLPFFVLLSLAGIVLVLNPGNAASLVAVGLVLIGICHLPVSFRVRGVVLLCVGALLAALRGHWLDGPVADAVWPILGSMFMFRLIVYFYDLRHDKVPGSPLQAMAYFFMLPNVCFPLFPVVDYKTFRRNYFDDDAYRTYQVGIDWMVRGVIHLVLYRYVYYYLTLAPSEVVDPADLSQYIVTNFLLYLRVSGSFHLIIGLMYLFGYRLPETHNRYLLASSFTDFWRRINIYWKDFMQKVFYYPAVFRLRGLGTTKAMVIATMYVFVLTWFLHAWQWFWLRGTALLVIQDVLFWVILGGLVVVNSLYELKHGRSRSLGKPEHTWGGIIRLTVRRYATFWAICIVWSFWTADSLAAWWALWPALGGTWSLDVLLYPGIVFAVILLGGIEQSSVRNTLSSRASRDEWVRTRLATVVAGVLLVGISIQGVHSHFNAELATTINSLRSSRLSRLDEAKLQRGYYESLLSVNRFNSQLWEVYTEKPETWLDVRNAGLKRFTSGFAQTELIPSFVSESNFGPISINRWGMRDRDYDLARPSNTVRIAVLGASSVMGWGVGDGETFEAVLEDRLNAGPNENRRFEILNFAVPGYQPLQQAVALEKALTFEPTSVFYVAAGRQLSRASWYLVEAVQKQLEIPWPALRDIAARAGLTADMDETTGRRRVEPYREELLAWLYGHIVEQSRLAGATPVLVFLPQLQEGAWEEETPRTLELAARAGFAVIDLSGVYEGQDVAAIWLAPWDHHPNRRGHELVAGRLYDELLALNDLVLQGAATVGSTGQGSAIMGKQHE